MRVSLQSVSFNSPRLLMWAGFWLIALYVIVCPHSAFVDPAAPEDAPLRESVEARCLVFY